MLFERRCAGCGRVGPAVCDACLAELVTAHATMQPTLLEGRVDSFVATFAYDRLAARVILAAKNGGRRDVLRALAPPMAAASRSRPAPDVVTWVPASRARSRRRGYDQSEVVARAVGRRLAVPARRLLGRDRGEAQAHRQREQRLEGPTLRLASHRVPARILLVDDVTTTGSSLAAGADTLRAGGATVVDAVTIAVVVDDTRRGRLIDRSVRASTRTGR